MQYINKAADLSSVIFGCVGSNPTSGISHILSARVAQLVEHWSNKPTVAGSIPVVSIIKYIRIFMAYLSHSVYVYKIYGVLLQKVQPKK